MHILILRDVNTRLVNLFCNTASTRVKGKNNSYVSGDCLVVRLSQYVHKQCRRHYCHPNNDKLLRRHNNNIYRLQRRRRMSEYKFNFKENCLFYETVAKIASNKRCSDVFLVKTLDFKSSISDFWRKMRTEEWSENVLGRLEYTQNLLAPKCSIHFRTGSSIPVKYHIRSIYKQIRKEDHQAEVQICRFPTCHVISGGPLAQYCYTKKTSRIVNKHFFSFGLSLFIFVLLCCLGVFPSLEY